MNPDSITVAVLFALSFSFLLLFVFYSRFSLIFKLCLIFIAFFLFILSYNLIDEMLGKPRITKLEFVEGDRFIYIAHDCIEPNKIENTLGKMFVIYRKEEGDNFNIVPEISEFPYDRRYCEAFSDAEKYQIYKFEKVDTEELDNFLNFFVNGAMQPGVIECSPPRVNGKIFLFKISSFIFEILFNALFIFLSILKGFNVLIPIFL